MWVPLSLKEIKGIVHYVGVLLMGMAAVMVVPLITALLWREWDPALDYLVGVSATVAVSAALLHADLSRPAINHRQAFIIAPLAWLTASLLGAIPFALSGHFGGYLDALFDTVSGLTTSGLTLTRDLDHMANAHNMWRHLTHLIGGQGIIVAAVSLAIGLKGGAISLYIAEGRDERILPNVVHTARFIWVVTAVWVALGTVTLAAVNLWLGMPLDRSVLHGFWITAAAYDTGGFGPQSQNVLYYHSAVFEYASLFLMLAGTFNFNLHADIWRGDRKEILQNLEARTLFGNLVVLTAFAGLALGATRLYNTIPEIVRKGVYLVISANSGTGHQTVYPVQWSEMGPLMFFTLILAMAFGGMVSSTAGGIKSLRIGIVIKAVFLEIRRMFSPPSAVVRTSFHHMTDRPLSPQLVSTALMVVALYLFTYLTGGLIGTMYGYPLADSMFESVSAAANVGLSSGITSPDMPTGLKVTYIVQMWAGRLEFLTLAVMAFAIVVSIKHRLVRS